jgi:integral membrane protein
MLRTTVGRLRLIALAEGVSFLVLLFIAMPLKYLADIPEAVRVTGMVHGILWVAFVGALGHAWATLDWPLRKLVMGLIGSVTPFGPFLLEASLRREAAPAA